MRDTTTPMLRAAGAVAGAVLALLLTASQHHSAPVLRSKVYLTADADLGDQPFTDVREEWNSRG